jgi:hypothetical protein
VRWLGQDQIQGSAWGLLRCAGVEGSLRSLDGDACTTLVTGDLCPMGCLGLFFVSFAEGPELLIQFLGFRKPFHILCLQKKTNKAERHCKRE